MAARQASRGSSICRKGSPTACRTAWHAERPLCAGARAW
jgi:hypothetical protein